MFVNFEISFLRDPSCVFFPYVQKWKLVIFYWVQSKFANSISVGLEGYNFGALRFVANPLDHALRLIIQVYARIINRLELLGTKYFEVLKKPLFSICNFMIISLRLEA